ncbi:MAG: ASCH domain-containing protein [Treponema sp.]|nr:ASCH domain-containing protein [Treponema sp.]
MTISEYWNNFTLNSGLDATERYAGELSFEAHNFTGDEQLALVLGGKKTATFSAYASYSIDNEPLPVMGECYIVVDRNEEPHCIIEVNSVTVVPFDQVTWEMAQREGEDENLEAWRDKQTEYLHEDAHIVGYDFTPNLNLVYMTFSVVYR